MIQVDIIIGLIVCSFPFIMELNATSGVQAVLGIFLTLGGLVIVIAEIRERKRMSPSPSDLPEKIE